MAYDQRNRKIFGIFIPKNTVTLVNDELVRDGKSIQKKTRLHYR